MPAIQSYWNGKRESDTFNCSTSVETYDIKRIRGGGISAPAGMPLYNFRVLYPISRVSDGLIRAPLVDQVMTITSSAVAGRSN